MHGATMKLIKLLSETKETELFSPLNSNTLGVRH